MHQNHVLTIVVTTSTISVLWRERFTGEKRRREDCPEEAAFLELLLTTDMLSRGLVKVLKSEDLSATQYNVLRILRGSPAGLPCAKSPAA